MESELTRRLEDGNDLAELELEDEYPTETSEANNGGGSNEQKKYKLFHKLYYKTCLSADELN